MSVPTFEDVYYTFGEARSSKSGTLIYRISLAQHLRNYQYYMEEFFPGHTPKHLRTTVSLVKGAAARWCGIDNCTYCNNPK